MPRQAAFNEGAGQEGVSASAGCLRAFLRQPVFNSAVECIDIFATLLQRLASSQRSAANSTAAADSRNSTSLHKRMKAWRASVSEGNVA